MSVLEISSFQSNVVYLFEGHTSAEGLSRTRASLVMPSTLEMSDSGSRVSSEKGCFAHRFTTIHPGRRLISLSVLPYLSCSRTISVFKPPRDSS